MAHEKVLLVLLFFGTMTKGLTHIGQRCRLIKICLPKNAYCDNDWICRCKPDYPVNISPHTCKKGIHYGGHCNYPEECRYFDPNSYCNQVLYGRSTCDCLPDFVYSKSNQVCEQIVSNTPRSSGIVLPTAIGLSLAFAGILCCFMVLWHLCRRQTLGHWSFLSRNTLSAQSPSHHQTQVESQNAFLGTDETLPNYDTALTLKSSDEDCDPPPSYEEVIGNSVGTSKV